MRLFVALELNEAIKASVRRLQDKLARNCEGVKWVPPEQVHLTVKFLGEVPDQDVPKIAEAVTVAGARSNEFVMNAEGCGCFPPSGSVRIVWVGAKDDGGQMLRCVSAVEDEMEKLGFAREQRPFAAHLTIGRVKEDRSRGQIRTAVSAAKFDRLSQEMKSMTLMSSVLSPKGPTYAPVSRARFASA